MIFNFYNDTIPKLIIKWRHMSHDIVPWISTSAHAQCAAIASVSNEVQLSNTHENPSWRIVSMNCFGFGFNAFGQISDRGKPSQGDDDEHSYTCLTPIRLNHLGGREEVAECQQGRVGTDQLSACWSRTASLCLHGETMTSHDSSHDYIYMYFHNLSNYYMCCHVI